MDTVTVKLALPLASVVAVAVPRKVWPWPKPEGSAVVLEKKSRLKVVLGVLVSVPEIVVPLAELATEVKTGDG